MTAAISRVCNSGRFVLGPDCQQFEEAMAAYCGVRHAIGCASGSDALLLALMAYEVERARALYLKAEARLPRVERRSQWLLVALKDIYKALLDEMVACDYDVLTHRVSLSKGRKLMIAMLALKKSLI